jgi:hypothetical protein
VVERGFVRARLHRPLEPWRTLKESASSGEDTQNNSRVVPGAAEREDPEVRRKPRTRGEHLNQCGC